MEQNITFSLQKTARLKCTIYTVTRRFCLAQLIRFVCNTANFTVVNSLIRPVGTRCLFVIAVIRLIKK